MSRRQRRACAPTPACPPNRWALWAWVAAAPQWKPNALHPSKHPLGVGDACNLPEVLVRPFRHVAPTVELLQRPGVALPQIGTSDKHKQLRRSAAAGWLRHAFTNLLFLSGSVTRYNSQHWRLEELGAFWAALTHRSMASSTPDPRHKFGCFCVILQRRRTTCIQLRHVQCRFSVLPDQETFSP